MFTREGQNQDDAVESGESSESSLTGLLHGFKDPDKKGEQTRLKTSLSAVLIASLCFSVVLLVAIYKIGLQGFSLRGKVEDLAQENVRLAETLKSMEEKVLRSNEEIKGEPPIPAKSAPEKPRAVRKRLSAKPSRVSKIIYRVKDGDSLSRLSDRFGVSVEQICSWNSIEQIDPLVGGEVLVINKTMTTDDLPDVAQGDGLEEVDEIDNEGGGASARRQELPEIGIRGTTDYISKQIGLEQINEAAAKAEAANKAIEKLQEKLDSERKIRNLTIAMLQEEVQERKALEEKLAADYISKKTALEKFNEARAEAEAASKAIVELQAKLDSQRKEYEQTVERLEEEAEKEKSLQEESVTKKVHGDPGATGKVIGRQPTSPGKTGEHPASEGQEASTEKPVNETVHIIRAGENLYRIGVKYGVSWKTLLKFNNLADANAIYVGQRIRIPRREKADARPTSLDEG